MPTKLFIDGREGTTGLRIFERLQNRDDLEIIILPEEQRKDPIARKEALHAADIAILCLPDVASRESVALAEGSKVRILDTSTAHRTADGWTYGFPELNAAQKQAISAASRVAVPGCHASGFIATVAPLVHAGLLDADAGYTCFSVTGYSGGGKKMIAQYDDERRDIALDSPRQYGITQSHKHLPEMQHICHLKQKPIFAPIVSDFYSGMVVSVPLFASQIKCASDPVETVRAALANHYADSKLVHVLSAEETDALGGFIASNTLSGKDTMEIMVAGNDERLQLICRFDNLGKGSSGAALQCLNLMMGLDETYGLTM